jgi:hypothetical protein
LFKFSEVGKVKKLFVFVLVVLAVGLSANAAFITYNGTVSPSTLGSTVTTDLPMFNGTGLTGVQVTLNFTVTPYAQVANFQSPYISRNFLTTDWITFGYTPANIWTVTHGADSWNLAAPTVSTGTIYGSNQLIEPFSVLTLVGSNSAPVSLTAASGLDLAGYTGIGTLTFLTSGMGQVQISDGLLMGGGGGNLTGTASVTYEYIPEPATLMLLSLGGLLFRKKK